MHAYQMEPKEENPEKRYFVLNRSRCLFVCVHASPRLSKYFRRRRRRYRRRSYYFMHEKNFVYGNNVIGGTIKLE